MLDLLKTFGLYLMYYTSSTKSAENIAFQKPASQSSTWNPKTTSTFEATKAVDGHFSQSAENCAHGDKEENVLNWFMVDLLDVYHVSQVILTPRDYPDAAVIKRMDFVYIGISNSPSISGKVEYPSYPLCRQSPYKADQTQNMSISCRPNTPSGRFVVVQQPATQYGYLTICEIQVYGTKLGNTSIGNYACKGNYYGDKCDKYCNCDKGVKCDQQGICPNGCDANWEGEHCDIRTFNIKQMIGCYMSNFSVEDEFIRFNSTNCIVTCSGYGFTFGANMTTDTCLCANVVNRTLLVQNENCHKDCDTEKCLKPVYSVCPNGTYGYDCTLKCNCLNKGRCSYMEGRCEDDCASGWTGASCDIRDCSKYNGGCGEWETCVSDSSDVASCQCTEGFSRTSALLPCQRLSDSSPMSYQSKSAIIGGVVGSLGVLCLIVVFITLLVKYRKRLKGSNSTSEKPSFQNEGANSTTTNPELYETSSTTDMNNENKYQSLKSYKKQEMKMQAVFLISEN